MSSDEEESFYQEEARDLVDNPDRGVPWCFTDKCLSVQSSKETKETKQDAWTRFFGPPPVELN